MIYQWQVGSITEKSIPESSKKCGMKMASIPAYDLSMIFTTPDRGYSTAAGIHHVAKSKEAFVIVRVNSKALPMLDLESRTFPLLERIQSIKSAGDLKSWEVLITGKGNATVGGRVYAIRKTNEAIELAIKKLKREASKHGHKIEPDTFEYARYVIVFSNCQRNVSQILRFWSGT